MSDNDIQIILRRLEVMDENRQHDVERLHAKLDNLTCNGCAQAPSHQATAMDHEDRIRGLEKYINRQVGQVAVVGGLSAVLVMIGKFFLLKLGGAQ